MSIDAIGSSSFLTALTRTSSTSTLASALAAATASTASTTSGTSGTATHRVPGHIEAASEVLGLSTDDIMEALQNGSSLSDLAEEQGVSRDDLVSALVEAAPGDMQAMGDIEGMVSSLVDQTGMPGPAGPPPSGSSGVWGETLTSDQQETIDSLSSLLGTDSTTLLDQLYRGSSLSDLLSDAGVSLEDLADVVQDGLFIDASA
jgi:lambda repressor-like predicted transcriptional regulator